MTTTSETVAEQSFRAEPRATSLARRALVDLIGPALDAQGLEDAKLLLSELVTNAIRHGPTGPDASVLVRVTVRDDAVRVDVVDQGDGFRWGASDGPRDVGGWGLMLVDNVAARWGIREGGPTTVWFEIDRAGTTGAVSAWPASFDPELLDAELAGVIAADVRGTITRWNRHATRMFGLPAAEAIGRPITDVLVAGDDRAGADALLRLLNEAESWDGEWLAPRKGGGRIWVRLAISPVRDRREERVGTVIVSLDISERRRAQMALATSEERLRIALEAGRMGTWDWDMRSGTVRWSESLERIHGHQPGAFGGTFEDFQTDIHPEDRGRVIGAIRRVVDAAAGEGSDYALDYRIVRRSDGAVRWLSTHGRALRDEAGRATGMAGVCADITERKQAERALAVQYALAQVLAEAGSVEEATPRLLEAIATALSWEVGALWHLDEDDQVLRYVGGWTATATTGRHFLQKSREFLMERGLGLPGRVWATGRPAWIPDVAADDNFPRAPFALEEGLHAGFGFPITIGFEVLGVMEFFSRRIREPDEDVLALMGGAGAQIGQFLERRAAEAELVESEARKSAILESALEAIVTMDEHGAIVEMNAAAAEMFGLDRQAALGRELAEVLIPTSLRERHREALRRFRRTGVGRILGRRLEFAALRADGTEFPVEITITRVALPDPEEILFTGYVRDITPRRRAEELQARLFESERAIREQAERANQRSAFLAEASGILGGSLDHRRTLSKIARLIVPRLADWCTVDLADADGTIQSVAVAHADPERVALVREYRRRFPPDPSTEGGVADVIETGEPVLYPELGAEELAQRMPDPDRRALLAELGLHSVMVVPLKARGVAIGSITFASAESGRRYGEEDLDLAMEVARRAAVALDNARLYEERSHIARTLQRTLLPRRLPEIANLEVAAFYQPAGVMQTEVGGDFYDVFEAGADGWEAVVGDVCGKGIEAAALTGLARHTLRASALRAPFTPSEALEDLNRVMLREDGERFCTVALGRVRHTGAGADLTVACGGHPAPMVIRGSGGVERVGGPGSLLGIFEDISIEDRTTELEPGDQVVFFTDGLIDSRHPTPLDEEDLHRLAATCGGIPAQETVDRLGEAIADPGGEAPDDVCIVVIRVGP